MRRSERFIQNFLDILVEQKMIASAKTGGIRQAFAASSIEEFDDFLIEEGLVDADQVLIALGLYYQVPYFGVDGHFFELFLLHKFPKDVLLRNEVIPLEVEGDMMIMIAADPTRLGLDNELRNYVSYDLNYLVGIGRDIEDAINEFYDESLTQDIENDDAHEPVLHSDDEYRPLYDEQAEEDDDLGEDDE